MSEKRYEPHKTDENKFQSTFDEYGHGEGNGKASQSINRRWRKLAEVTNEAEVITEPVEEIVEPVEEDVPTHEWLNVGVDEEGESILSELPSKSKNFLKILNSQSGDMTTTQRALFRKQQAKLIRHGFSGIVDPLCLMYCRGVVGKEKASEFDLNRTEDDWVLLEGVTENWLEYHDLTIPINPDLMLAGVVGVLYVPPVAKAHKNRDPSRVTLFGKVKGRFLSWRAKKRLQKLGVEEFE